MTEPGHQTRLRVGVFMLAGLACVAWIALSLGGTGLIQDGRYEVTARFGSVSGLREGAWVELAGVRVGNVASISVDPEYYEAVVTLRLEPQVRLQTDAIASVRTAGIIGEKFIKITPGGAEALVPPGGELLETESSISLEELVSKYIFESSR